MILDRCARSRPLARPRDTAEGNRAWARDAPILMLAAAATVLLGMGALTAGGPMTPGAASMSLCVQATKSGLMASTELEGFDPERLRLAFAIPDTFSPTAMMAIGYQLPESRIPEGVREREYARPLATAPCHSFSVNGDAPAWSAIGRVDERYGSCVSTTPSTACSAIAANTSGTSNGLRAKTFGRACGSSRPSGMTTKARVSPADPLTDRHDTVAPPPTSPT